jgi:nitrite reductase/ring-hydroxylating ferredoxin subunit
MTHAEQVRLLRTLMTHLDNETNVDAGRVVQLPVSAYSDPERAAAEWQTLFRRHPQVLGLSGDLPGPNSFFTSNDLGTPILCTRDKDGVFRAFLNVCRHRGVIVENEPCGKKGLFTCPFHAWSYDTQGRLMAIPKPDQFGGIDRAQRGLVELPAVERFGLLWVNADKDGAVDVDSLLGPELSAEMESWRFDECTRAGEAIFPHACNWKLANDTYGETYHFDTLHRFTFSAIFYGNVQTYDTYGRNHRMGLCSRAIDTLRIEPEQTWHVLRGALPVYFLFPNIQLVVSGEGPILVRIYPDAENPHQSRSVISMYTFPETKRVAPPQGAGDRPSSRMETFASIIQAEDYVAAASSHRGVLSGAQTHVIFGRNEPALHHYHSVFNAALGLESIETYDG